MRRFLFRPHDGAKDYKDIRCCNIGVVQGDSLCPKDHASQHENLESDQYNRPNLSNIV